MKKSFIPVLVVGAFTLMAQASDAAVIAAFQPAKNFTYTYGTSFNLNPDKQVVSFAYDPSAAFYASLPVELQALSISSKLVFWTSAADPGAFTGFGSVNQPLSSVSFEFVNAAPFTIGFTTFAAGTINLLSGTADTALLTVVTGPGGQITYSGSTLDIVVYTATYVPTLSSYSNTSFSITGNQSNNAGILAGYLQNYKNPLHTITTGLEVKLNGNFSADVPVPEPGAVALLMGSGVAGTGLLLRRRRSK